MKPVLTQETTAAMKHNSEAKHFFVTLIFLLGNDGAHVAGKQILTELLKLY